MTCRNKRKMAQALAADGAQDARSLNRMIAKLDNARLKTADVMYEIYINSILSGPITHGINVGSNAILTLWSPAETFMEGVSAASRLDFQKSHVEFQKTGAKLTGLVTGFSDVLRMGWKKQSLSDLNYHPELQSRHEIIKQKHNPSITAEKLLKANHPLAAAVDFLGNGIRLSGDMLLKEDRWFKMMHYRMEVNSQAVEKAMARTDKSVQARKGFAEYLKANPDDETVHDAIGMAEYFTFTKKLGPTGNLWVGAVRSVPTFRYFFPFMNTPTNIVKMGVSHSALGQMFDRKLMTDLISSDAASKDLARAKVSLGTIIPGIILSQMDEDRITGRINMATPDGRFQASQGRPEYSLKVGDQWISYANIEPFRSIVGMYVTAKTSLHNVVDYDPETGAPTKMADDIVTAAIAPIVQTIGDNYMLSSIGGVLDVINSVNIGNAEETLQVINKTFRSMTQPAFLRQFNRVYLDDTYRKADTYLETLQQTYFPGFSQTLPARRTLWGDEQHYDQNHFWDIISPVFSTSVKQDAVDRQMIDLGVSIPGLPRSLSMPGGNGQKAIKIDLTERQREQLAIVRGKGYQGSPTLKQSITRFMNSSAYKVDPRTNKAKISEMDKILVIESIINQYETAARDVLKGTPEVLQAYQKAIDEREDQRNRTRQ